MTDTYKWTKADLLHEINTSWTALNAALDHLTPEQMSGPTDAAGWGVKDHLNHLAAWENSVTAVFQGRPRHEGLGIDQALYESDLEDTVNDELYRRDANLTAAAARDNLREAHARLLAELEPLTDADLKQPIRHYLPHWPGEGDGPPVAEVVFGDTAEHFGEHLEWIQALTN